LKNKTLRYEMVGSLWVSATVYYSYLVILDGIELAFSDIVHSSWCMIAKEFL
jgi:hypothetical protein